MPQCESNRTTTKWIVWEFHLFVCLLLLLFFHRVILWIRFPYAFSSIATIKRNACVGSVICVVNDEQGINVEALYSDANGTLNQFIFHRIINWVLKKKKEIASIGKRITKKKPQWKHKSLLWYWSTSNFYGKLNICLFVTSESYWKTVYDDIGIWFLLRSCVFVILSSKNFLDVEGSMFNIRGLKELDYLKRTAIWLSAPRR